VVLAIVFHCLGHSKNVYDDDDFTCSAPVVRVIQLQEAFLGELERLRGEQVRATQEIHVRLSALTVRREATERCVCIDVKNVQMKIKKTLKTLKT